MLWQAMGGMLAWLRLLQNLAAAERAREFVREPAKNAALKYWQAFAALPALTPAQETIVREWHKAPFEDRRDSLPNCQQSMD